MDKKLYKYAESEWSQALLERGSVRIGTLYDFRKKEHKEGIQDTEEGLKSIIHKIDSWQHGDENSPHHYANESYELIHAPGAKLKDVTLIQDTEDDDCFIYCTAHTLSKDVLQQFKGADSCVEIYNLQAFYDQLTHRINERVPVDFRVVMNIKYQTREEAFYSPEPKLPGSLIKAPRFAPQCEVRAIWTPKSDHPIEATCFEDMVLTKYCRAVDF